MSNTPVLQLTSSDWGALNEPFYPERSLEDTKQLANNTAIDAFAGKVTGSFCSKFSLHHSGVNSAMNMTHALLPGYIGSEYSPNNRVIMEVVAWAAKSGSGGVSRVDVQIQQGSTQPANFASIFSNNAFKPAVSASLGDFGRVSCTTFVSGTNMVWGASSSLKVVQDTAAGAEALLSGQYGLTVEVLWKPSGSYGV